MKSIRKDTVIKIILFIPLGCIYFLLFVFKPFYYFKDRDSYLMYAEYPEFFRNNYDGYQIFFNEPLFLIFNELLGLFLKPENVVYFFLIFNVFSLILFLYLYSRDILSAFLGFLFVGLSFYTFNMQFVLLRFFLATVIFIYICFFKEGRSKFLLFLPFIHAAFFIVLPIVLIHNKFFEKLNKYWSSVLTLLLSFFATGIAFVLGNYLGARQVLKEGLADEKYTASGLFFIFFFMLLLYFLFFIKKIDYLYKVSICGLSVFLGMYFTSILSSRMMGFFIFPILLVLIREDGYLSKIVLCLMVLVFGYIAFNIDTMSILVPYSRFFENILGQVL